MVDPFLLADRYGADAIRYHILREMALGADSSFSNEIMINRINSDLANGLGNLVSRTVAMVDKYFGGTLPTERQSGEFDEELIAAATGLTAKLEGLLDQTQLNHMLAEIFQVVSRANKYRGFWQERKQTAPVWQQCCTTCWKPFVSSPFR